MEPPRPSAPASPIPAHAGPEPSCDGGEESGAGDREALEKVLHAEMRVIKRRIRHRIRHLTSASQSASDVAQEAAIRVLGATTAPEFPSRAALRGYLWTTALNLLRRRLRQDQLAAVREDVGSRSDWALAGDGGRESSAEERSVALHLALNLLRPGERRILELVYFEGHDTGAAARMLGIEPENARMRLVRARRALMQKLRTWTEIVEDA